VTDGGGFIVQATGSFVPAFLASAAIGLCSALAYFTMVRNTAGGRVAVG
jgi:hypothetical protein